MPDRERAELLYQLSSAAAETGKFRAALEVAEEGLQADPKHADLHLWVSTLYFIAAQNATDLSRLARTARLLREDSPPIPLTTPEEMKDAASEDEEEVWSRLRLDDLGCTYAQALSLAETHASAAFKLARDPDIRRYAVRRLGALNAVRETRPPP